MGQVSGLGCPKGIVKMKLEGFFVEGDPERESEDGKRMRRGEEWGKGSLFFWKRNLELES